MLLHLEITIRLLLLGIYQLLSPLIPLSAKIQESDKLNPSQKQNENNLQCDEKQYVTDAALSWTAFYKAQSATFPADFQTIRLERVGFLPHLVHFVFRVHIGHLLPQSENNQCPEKKSNINRIYFTDFKVQQEVVASSCVVGLKRLFRGFQLA